MDKFLIACCLFCFITGMYCAVLIEKDRGCTVEVQRGQVVTVTVGRSEQYEELYIRCDVVAGTRGLG